METRAKEGKKPDKLTAEVDFTNKEKGIQRFSASSDVTHVHGSGSLESRRTRRAVPEALLNVQELKGELFVNKTKRQNNNNSNSDNTPVHSDSQESTRMSLSLNFDHAN